MSTETLEQTFQVTGPARLRVANVCGRVVIRPGQPGQLQATAVKHSSPGNADLTIIEMTQAADGAVSIAARFPAERGLARWFAQACEVDFTITVPPDCSVEARVVSAGLDVAGLSGEFAFHSVSGDIRLSALKGGLKLRSVSGDVQGEDLSGQADIDLVSGRCALSRSDLHAVQSRSVSGDLMLETGLGAGPYAFRSVSGDVRLQVPAEARFTATLRTVSGEIYSGLPQTRSERRRREQVVDVQGGGPAVAMNSVSGALWVGAPAAG